MSPIVFCKMGGIGVRLVGALFPGLHVITEKGIVGIVKSRSRSRLFLGGVHRMRGCYRRFGSLDRSIVLSVVGNGTPIVAGRRGLVVRKVGNGPVITHARGRRHLIGTFRRGSLIFTANPTKANGAFITVTLTIGTLGGGRVHGVVLDHPTMRTNRGLKFLPNRVGSGLSPCLRPLCSTLRSVIPKTGLGRCVRGGIVRVTPLTFVHKQALGSTIVVLSRTRGAAARRVGVFLAHLKVGTGVVVAKSIARVSLPPATASNLMRTVRVLGNMGKVNGIRFRGGSVIHRGLIRHVIRTCSGFSDGRNGNNSEAISGRRRRRVGGGVGGDRSTQWTPRGGGSVGGTLAGASFGFPKRGDICRNGMHSICGVGSSMLIVITASHVSTFSMILPRNVPCGKRVLGRVTTGFLSTAASVYPG